LPDWAVAFVRIVDRVNLRVGRLAMYLLFVMMGILLWSSISKVISGEPFDLLATPSHWTLLMAQFSITAYYMLGGPYSLQLGSNVRMDLLYGNWTPRGKAWADALTAFALLFYLGVLLYGGIVSTDYAITYGERAPGIWRAYLWPIKVVMLVGITLMIFQALAMLVRDIATIRGIEIDAPEPDVTPTRGEGG